MKYHLDLFTPETWQAFTAAGATCTGFRMRQRRLAQERVKPGDVFLCYMTRLSRWRGVLEVESEPFYDETPRFDTHAVHFLSALYTKSAASGDNNPEHRIRLDSWRRWSTSDPKVADL